MIIHDKDDLKFEIDKRFDNFFELINRNQKFLIEVSDRGLLLEPDIRSDVYDLDYHKCLKIIGVDEEVLL